MKPPKPIRMSRVRLGWTLRDLSQRTGIDPHNLSVIERQPHRARTTTLDRINAAIAAGQQEAGL